MLLTNTRNHTRNKISASAEAGIDKDVRRDIAVGKGGGMQRRRWRQRKEQGATELRGWRGKRERRALRVRPHGKM